MFTKLNLIFLEKIKFILSSKEKKFFSRLVVFSILISLIEMIGVSIIMPFMAVATDLTLIDTNKYYKLLYSIFNSNTKQNFVILFGVIVIIFYIVRIFINTAYIYLLNKFAEGLYYSISYKLFKTYMSMKYIEYIQNNSSNLTKNIMQESSQLVDLLRNVLLMISEISVMILIYAMLLYINLQVTITLTLFLLISVFVLIKPIGKKLKELGNLRASLHSNLYEIVNKNFNNFKMIKLRSDDNNTFNEFHEPLNKLTSLNIKASTMTNLPKIFLEGIGFTLIVLLIIYLFWKFNDEISIVLATISVFILSLFRLLPSVTRISAGYNSIMLSFKSLEIVYNDLKKDYEINENNEIYFEKKIEFINVSFSYKNDKKILENISLEIYKRDKIAFIGESGSGKSTIIDILMGLHTIEHGNIKIDDISLNNLNIISWRKKIGYIPQSVFLFDGTIAENVVFGREFNQSKIIEVLKKAHVYDFLNLKDGLNTKVGESGLLLSGGQKQRIAIARALYGNPEILVLDEATSALDSETELKIMNEVYSVSNDMTLIIIAHRLSTIKGCNKVYRVKKGKLYNEN